MKKTDPDDITRCPRCLKFVGEDKMQWHLDHECDSVPGGSGKNMAALTDSGCSIEKASAEVERGKPGERQAARVPPQGEQAKGGSGPKGMRGEVQPERP